jgi:hypothetical protein
MIVMRDPDGELNRLYLPVTLDDAVVLAIVDCGTPRTWLRAPGEGAQWVDDLHVATMAGQRMVIPGRRVPAFEEAAGLPPVVGCVGNDFLLAAVTVLDVETATLTRMASLDPTFLGWPALGFEVQAGMIFVDAVLDGEPRRCQLDTGAPASVLLRDGGGLDDDTGEGRDVLGNALPMRKGRGTFAFGGRVRDVPIWKMRAFPHLEEVGRLAGQSLDGMVGLSSLGQTRIVLDPFGQRLLLEPLA